MSLSCASQMMGYKSVLLKHPIATDSSLQNAVLYSECVSRLDFSLNLLTPLFPSCPFRAKGYKSTIRLQLTPENIPPTLRRVHLRIVLEGTLFTRVFEADPNLKFTYAWDRRDVYRSVLAVASLSM